MTDLTITKNDVTAITLPAINEDADAREALQAAFGSGGINRRDLDSITIPPGGGTMFTVPGAAGDEPQKELTGVILGQQDKRAYWSIPLDQSGGNSLPDCHSDDAVCGDRYGPCSLCRFSKFGSDSRGERQACKATRELLFLRHGHTVPNIIPLPPSSIEGERRYVTRLASFGLPPTAVVTKVGLERAQNRQGIAYSRATFTCVGTLTPEQRDKLKQYMQLIQPRAAEGASQTLELTEPQGELLTP